jgi:hypothetical protein
MKLYFKEKRPHVVRHSGRKNLESDVIGLKGSLTPNNARHSGMKITESDVVGRKGSVIFLQVKRSVFNAVFGRDSDRKGAACLSYMSQVNSE